MRSTFHGIESMKRSLFTHQTSLQTVGHNISNANTKGYSRQKVNHVAMFPLEYPSLMRSNIPGQMGQGVEFDSILRVREKFLDNQYYKESSEHGQWNIRRDTLEKIEAIMNEPSDTGIRRVLEKFWNAWQDLSKDPENLSARAVVKEQSIATAEAFNHISRQLSDLSDDIRNTVDVKVKEINTYLDQMAAINKQVFRMELLGHNANDLRDRRDLLVDEISKVLNINVVEESEGYTLKAGNIELVKSSDVSNYVTATSLETAFNNGDITSGEVFGLFTSIERYTDYYSKQMDSLVQSFVSGDFSTTLTKGTVIPEGTVLNGVTYSGANRTLANDTVVTVKGINQMHQLGYQLRSPLKKGEDLFVLKEGATEMTAASITVNPNIIADLEAIAASTRTYVDGNGVERTAIGNGLNALNIATMRQSKIEFAQSVDSSLTVTGTYDDFFRSLIGGLGVQAQEAVRQENNQKLLVDQVDSRRQSISGVSMDEEMADMVKFQHAYNAAARALTTYDEMLERIINGMGQVGR